MNMNQHNTQTALQRVVDDWLYNISDGNLICVCSFYIMKCFDTINHGILLDKKNLDLKIMLEIGFNHILTKGIKLYHAKIK